MTPSMEMHVRSLEFLRVELCTRSYEYEVDQSMVKEGLCLKFVTDQERVNKEEKDKIYKGLTEEISDLRNFVFNKDGKHDVRVITISTNSEDDILYKTEYT